MTIKTIYNSRISSLGDLEKIRKNMLSAVRFEDYLDEEINSQKKQMKS